MAQIIGKINTLDGSFYIKGADGKLSSAKIGDTIYAGDIVVGSGSNSNSSSATVLLGDNSRTINILGSNQQLFDETMLTFELSSDAVVQEDELSEALLLESVENIVQENDISDEQATLTIEDIENLDAAAAGAEGPTDTEVLSARLEDRTGGEVDVTTDLRDSTDSAGGALVDDAGPVVIEGAPVISLIGESTTIIEGNSGSLILLSSEPPFEDVVVEFTYSGVAQDGTDFSGVASIIIPQGVDVVDFDLNTLTDGIYEGNEDFTIAISSVSGSNASISETDSEVDLTIIDSDELPVVSIMADPNSAVEGGESEVVFKIYQSGVSSFDTDVDFTLSLGEIELEDIASISYGNTTLTTALDIANFVSNGVTLTIPAGTTDMPTVTVIPTDDNIIEGTESFSGNIALSAGETDATLGTSIANAEFIDNDSGLVSIAATADAYEEGTVPGEFTVSLDKASSTDTVVLYSVQVGSTATDGGVDYTTLSGTVTITAGLLSNTIAVTGIVDDNLYEVTETVVVQLDSISSGDPDISIDGTNDTATVNIFDNDPVYAIIEGPATVDEGSTTGLYTIKLVDGGGNLVNAVQDLDVTVTFTNVDAEDGDYQYINNETDTFTISQGSSSVQFDVSTSDDADLDDDTFNVQITDLESPSGFSNLSIGSQDNLDTRIIDDDSLTLVGKIVLNEINLNQEVDINNDVTQHRYIEIMSIVSNASETTPTIMNILGLEIVGANGQVIEIANGFMDGEGLSAEGFLLLYEDGTWESYLKNGNLDKSGDWASYATVYDNPNDLSNHPYDYSNNDTFAFGSDTSEHLAVNLLQHNGGIVGPEDSIDYFVANERTVDPTFDLSYGTWVPDDTYFDGTASTDTAFTRVFGVDTADEIEIDSHSAIDWTLTSTETPNAYYETQEPVEGKNSSETINGTADNEYINAKSGDDTVDAGDGDDIIDGGAGADEIVGGAGSDILLFDASDTLIDGDDGGTFDPADDDRLILSDSDSIDFATLDNAVLKNIDSIDLHKNGDHALENLTLQDVIDMTDTTDKTLRITGDGSDSVELTGSGTWTSGSTTTIDSITYDVYTNDGDSDYKVLIQQDVDVL